MEARLVTPTKNILDVNLDELNEEELEAYVKQLDEARDKATVKIENLQDKIDGLDKEIQCHDKKIEEGEMRMKSHEEKIATLDLRAKKLDEEYDGLVQEMLKPLYTGEIHHVDLSKLQSDDPWFMDIIRRGPQPKDPASSTAQQTPPSSPEKSSVSSGGSSTPPSKVSSSDVSRNFSSLSLSNKSDSDSGDEQDRSKNSPQLAKLASSSQAMVMPPTAVVISAPAVKPSTSGQLPSKNKTACPSEKDPKQQIPAVTATATKAPAPQQKGLLAKLGFNKNKSAPQQLLATATLGVVPAVTQQKVLR